MPLVPAAVLISKKRVHKHAVVRNRCRTRLMAALQAVAREVAFPVVPGTLSPAYADKIGSLLFCSACGSLLDLPNNDDVLTCAPCGTSHDARSTWREPNTTVYDNLAIVTRSHPTAFPSILRQKRQLVSHTGDDGDVEMEQATIKEKCPGCGNEEMNYHTLQLRSADEGTTVFYDCPKCGYKFSQNN